MSEVRTYDLAAMHQFVADLDRRIEFLIEMHENARTSASTIRSGFSGRTGESFDVAHTDWQLTGEGHVAALRALRDRVESAAKNYEEAERANGVMLGDL